MSRERERERERERVLLGTIWEAPLKGTIEKHYWNVLLESTIGKHLSESRNRGVLGGGGFNAR